ncbi:MAG TPA: tRNA (adenosine(37)-N6)-threonylcarbamoyltransferase complex ATPase subunit type 1 TsaE [Thermoguttaceae bacterium]|nr:tRNA (adenosine(37)-N6)-threonylcarbamoyltransferase complex ATPase subunit type 1 TsaE [Thermoguttaceae bacterium]
MMNHFTYDAPDEAATARLGAVLAEILPDGTTVALCGTLGAGKTRLVQAVAEAAGVRAGGVTSPTFVLIQEYRARRTVYHFDAYRIRDIDEFEELGPDEYFESDALVLVEWADRVENALPRERIEVRIEVTGTQSRRFEIIGLGPRYTSVVELCRERLSGGV